MEEVTLLKCYYTPSKLDYAVLSMKDEFEQSHGQKIIYESFIRSNFLVLLNKNT